MILTYDIDELPVRLVKAHKIVSANVMLVIMIIVNHGFSDRYVPSHLVSFKSSTRTHETVCIL
jgi:hypothetical protein